ncbi:MAG TPA: hypothetical protein VIU14_03285 [Mesorhizobium sp.]
MSDCELNEGAGTFVFFDRAAGARQSIRVFYFRPAGPARDARFVVAMHGLDRAASVFRDVLINQAEQNGQIVLVPEFDAEAFPDVYSYNYGNVRLAPPSEAIMPPDLWNFGIIDRLFRHVRTAIGSDRTTFGLFGNSAGSQFVLRYLALCNAAAVDRGVASNCGIYMLPDLTIDYPVGMGGIGLGEGHLRKYLGQPLTILLGDADTDSAAFDLPRSADAMAQGPHRLARGFWHFDHCRQIAKNLGVAFHWKLEIAPGAGHVDQQIFDSAMDILANA